MRSTKTLVALALACFAQPAEAQSLAGISLSLGDAEARTIARFPTALSATTRGNGFWFISDTTKWNGAPDYGNVGILQFRNGALTSINKPWRDVASTTVGTTEYTVALLRQLSGEPNCVLKPQRLDDPEVQSEIMTVECKSRSDIIHSISITVSTQQGRKSVQFNESWVRVNPTR